MPLEPGKIIFLCGTSTSGKTSICTAAQAAAQSSRESGSTVDIVKSLGGSPALASRTKADPSDSDKISQTTAVATRGENKEPEVIVQVYEESTAPSSAKEREQHTPLPMTPKPLGK